MSPKKNILFTFDYELFLGERSGSVEKCMLEPTNKLITIFDRHKIEAAIFFVDTTYLIRLKEMAKSSLAAKEDFEKITGQLQMLIQKKHYVFPHIHPHWLDAEYNKGSNSWSLSNITKYRFHAISEAERTALFDQSISILSEIIQPIQPNYVQDGYRAGGWCIQPFSDFYPHFKRHQIKFDFSVLPGLKNLSSAQFYDFEKAPKLPVYTFENEVVELHPHGSFTQIPISVIHIPKAHQLANKFLLKYLWKTGNRSFGDGNGVVASPKEDSNPQMLPQGEMVSLELLNSIKLPLYNRFLKSSKIMHFISHPKMLSKHNLKKLEQFLINARQQYDLECDFRRMQE